MRRFFTGVFVVVVALFCVIFVPANNAKAATATTSPTVQDNRGVPWFPLVPCGLNQQPTGSDGKPIPKSVHDYTQDCNYCLLIELGKNLIDMTFFAIVPVIGTLFVIWAGFRILIGGRTGKPGAVEDGKKILKATLIGAALIFGSWLIANFILTTLAGSDKVNGVPWYQIQCKVGTLKDLTDGSIIVSNPSPTPTTTPGQGGQCVFSNINLCQPSATTPYSKNPIQCSASACSTYTSAINQYANGAATANLLKAIMVKESSCNSSADSGHAYGLMQLQPATANIYKNRCGVTTNITSDWLKQNTGLSICIAAAYINSIAQSACGSSVRNIAAGYNGGENGACAVSQTCSGQTSCDGSPMKRWECLYDGSAGSTSSCNTGYDETRDYALKVSYCANNPGF